MGVRLLNRFLKEYAKDCIHQHSLEHYRGKRIVVDASIYLYRYIGDNALIENYYLLCSLFRHYGIIPLFIFDGTPPTEKQGELKERASLKKKAKVQLKEIEQKINNLDEGTEKKDLETQKNIISKRCIHLKQWHLHDVKQLIQSCGIQYIEAPGEADHLCAKLVKEGYADACLSEDMDLFVHGCPSVLRYMSLTKQNVVEYSLKQILEELELSFVEFQEMCILSGTDYTKWITKEQTHEYPQKTIFQYYSDVKKFQRERLRKSPIQHEHLKSVNAYIVFDDEDDREYIESFIEWCKTKDIIDGERYQLLKQIQSMFDLKQYPELNNYCISIEYQTFNESELRKTLSYHNFY